MQALSQKLARGTGRALARLYPQDKTRNGEAVKPIVWAVCDTLTADRSCRKRGYALRRRSEARGLDAIRYSAFAA